MQHLQWEAENVSEKGGYGLGFDISFINDHEAFGHGGGFPGHSTKTLCDPEDGLVITVLTNAIDGWSGYMAKNVVKLIDFFQDKWQAPDKELEACEGRYMDLFLCINVMALGGRLYIGGSGWDAFDSPEELVPLSDKGEQAYMIVKSGSFSPGGELVKFKIGKDGKAKSMYYAGANLLSEKDYIAQTSKFKKIGEELEPK
jgi:hypothetical protein